MKFCGIFLRDTSQEHMFIAIKRFIFGKPLDPGNTMHTKLPTWKALAILSSDALSSVAYGTEEILLTLAAFSYYATSYSFNIAILISILLIIIVLSYWQIITAYPKGGGAYTVASENLGKIAGLIAASGLIIDYTLTVAVSIAVGAHNISSAFPLLHGYEGVFSACIICVMTVIHMRGTRESANIFTLPTYFFIVSIAFLLIVGIYKALIGIQTPIVEIVDVTTPALKFVPIALLIHAFASGCAALTGIEAISNGTMLFKKPVRKNAHRTLAWMAVILCTFFVGLTWLCKENNILPDPTQETLISILAHSVFGDTIFYYLIQASIAVILLLAANTSYADFPRLTAMLSKDGYLPKRFSRLGDKLVYSNGIMILGLASIFIIIVCNANPHHLIPLYAIGVFISFTLSQAGIIKYHLTHKKRLWLPAVMLNIIGVTATIITLCNTSNSTSRTHFEIGSKEVVSESCENQLIPECSTETQSNSSPSIASNKTHFKEEQLLLL